MAETDPAVCLTALRRDEHAAVMAGIHMLVEVRRCSPKVSLSAALAFEAELLEGAPPLDFEGLIQLMRKVGSDDLLDATSGKLVGRPGRCPECGSDSVEFASTSIDVDDKPNRDATCLDCKAEWAEVYRVERAYLARQFDEEEEYDAEEQEAG